jgi:hypothetical protein
MPGVRVRVMRYQYLQGARRLRLPVPARPTTRADIASGV